MRRAATPNREGRSNASPLPPPFLPRFRPQDAAWQPSSACMHRLASYHDENTLTTTPQEQQGRGLSAKRHSDLSLETTARNPLLRRHLVCSSGIGWQQHLRKYSLSDANQREEEGMHATSSYV